MRLIFAALFICGGMMGVVVLLSTVPEHEPPFWVLCTFCLISFFILFIIAFILFNVIGRRHVIGQGRNVINELEEAELLVSQDYEASRAFQIEEFEDEGPHYMIALLDGSVLYLNGQYLDDYEPIVADSEFKQNRLFPCMSFTVRRHKIDGYVVDLQCHGPVLEPEFVAPPFDAKDIKLGLKFEDGQVITGQTYDQLKARMEAHI